MIFPQGQSSTGWLALGLSAVAVLTFFATDWLGLGGQLMANLTCAGATMLAFILAAYAHVERNGRLEAARSALFVSVSLIVYFMYVRLRG
jgi:hypothetical protein